MAQIVGDAQRAAGNAVDPDVPARLESNAHYYLQQRSVCVIASLRSDPVPRSHAAIIFIEALDYFVPRNDNGRSLTARTIPNHIIGDAGGQGRPPLHRKITLSAICNFMIVGGGVLDAPYHRFVI